MIEPRIFPRYSVSKLKGQIKSSPETTVKLSLVNVSLGGLQVKTQNKLPFDKIEGFEINLGSQEFKVRVSCIWTEENLSKGTYSGGFFIRFDDMETFNKWMTFIKALHLLHKKKISPSPK